MSGGLDAPWAVFRRFPQRSRPARRADAPAAPTPPHARPAPASQVALLRTLLAEDQYVPVADADFEHAAGHDCLWLVRWLVTSLGADYTRRLLRALGRTPLLLAFVGLTELPELISLYM
ncbi:hypothetical protein Rsub_05737 [Raphidocelis subcapitata]|uniref:Uncharacterized protein n=1 Tax=Raphidocelis subcapitata TaxID=307507 RepID=A0A2V0NZ39_9CHLO|nr:hypothetical protein Rsub_05737 [Raphidocelis subcapitata]|eukprot:GBF92901.1 hypothetical protein Rsub_05737 [Raphidocelis subcapitata]